MIREFVTTYWHLVTRWKIRSGLDNCSDQFSEVQRLQVYLDCKHNDLFRLVPNYIISLANQGRRMVGDIQIWSFFSIAVPSSTVFLDRMVSKEVVMLEAQTTGAARECASSLSCQVMTLQVYFQRAVLSCCIATECALVWLLTCEKKWKHKCVLIKHMIFINLLKRYIYVLHFSRHIYRNTSE